MGKHRRINPNQRILCEVLRKLRVSANLSQQNLADYFNINRSTYTYYEMGKTMPDVATLKRLSELYKVPMEDFFSEEFLENLGESTPRPHKKVAKDPHTIGDLTPQEKSLIVALRLYPGHTEDAFTRIHSLLTLPDSEARP